MLRSVHLLAALILTALLSGCLPSTGSLKLYRVDDGLVTNIEFTHIDTRHNRGTATTADGETLEWEFRTISGMSTIFGGGLGTAKASSENVSSYDWARSMGFSFTQAGVQYGSFVAVGNKGTKIEGVYAVDPYTNHGHGVGKDNEDRRYRVVFYIFEFL